MKLFGAVFFPIAMLPEALRSFAHSRLAELRLDSETSETDGDHLSLKLRLTPVADEARYPGDGMPRQVADTPYVRQRHLPPATQPVLCPDE